MHKTPSCSSKPLNGQRERGRWNRRPGIKREKMSELKDPKIKLFGKTIELPETLSDKVAEAAHLFSKLSADDILDATDNLDEEKLIAKGGISSVYVGRFPDGSFKAVKLLNLDVQDALKIFNRECKIFRINHKNLVNILSCSQFDVKAAVVMPYMPNGDLEKWLYSTNCSLNLFERLRIMVDVACAVEYLHHYFLPTLVHCDLNPKNILLDERMVAHVCDFGMAKNVDVGEIMVDSRVLGTVGYIAPEYGSQGMISTAVDVYSYGILLLEMLSRRKPTDAMFSGELSMRKWVLESIPAFVSDIVENELRYMHTDEESRVTLESWLKSVVVLAQHCTEDSPRRIISINSNFNNLLNSFLA